MADLISRAAAIDALTNTNLKCNFDSLCDGDMNRTRRAAQRVIAQLPAVDAIPVEWLEGLKEKLYGNFNGLAYRMLLDVILNMWQKEQEAQDE